MRKENHFTWLNARPKQKQRTKKNALQLKCIEEDCRMFWSVSVSVSVTLAQYAMRRQKSN